MGGDRREINADEAVAPADGGDHPAARLEAGCRVVRKVPPLPEEMGSGEGGVPARSTSASGVNQRRPKPAILPEQEGGLGLVHLHRHRLHPVGGPFLREEHRTGQVAGAGFLGEGVDRVTRRHLIGAGFGGRRSLRCSSMSRRATPFRYQSGAVFPISLASKNSSIRRA